MPNPATLAAGLLTLVASVAAGQGGWDPTQPRGKTRQVAFSTSEGTWMSVDISPDGTWIVFDLLGHIYRIPAAGGTAVSLTQTSGIALNYHPRISPDGRQIAFISDRRGQDNLWVMNQDGGNPRAVFLDDNSRAIEPNWMPNGSDLVFTRRMKTPSGFYRTNDEIWMVGAVGGNPTLVARLSASGSSVPARAGVWAGQDRLQWPSPTPDGRYLYFHSSLFAGNGRQLKRVELSSGRIDDVTEDKDRYLTCCGRPAYPLRLGEIAPEVSPDGNVLAFIRKIPGARTAAGGQTYVGRSALWLQDLTTGRERVVMDPITSDEMDLHPAWEHRVAPGYAWAKDGKSLVLSQGGKIRRVWIPAGKVETIPFEARVERTISEQARNRHPIGSDSFAVRNIRWPATSPDGRTLVFEAVGRLWRKDLPNGAPSPLTATGDTLTELTPAWSPDGRWIAFTTWHDELGGHLYRVGAAGGAAEQLSRSASRYLYPEWSPDAQSIVVNRWAPELTYTVDGRGWEVVRIPGEGGPHVVVRGPGDPLDGSGSLRRSPDGRWIAAAQLHDIYLATGAATATDARALDLRQARRLTLEGGEWPRWRSAEVLEYAAGGRLIAHQPATGRFDTIPIGLTLRRDRADGSIALENARIITMENRRVIPRGTVVVRDGRIACLGICPTAGVGRRVDLAGKTIIPGLIDVHAHHLTEEATGMIGIRRSSSARYLAWGVTTAHDPATDPRISFSIAEMAEAGRIVGPRTLSTGIALTCSDFDTLREIETFEDARQHLVRAADRGAISIKDYKQCTRIQRQMLA